MTKTLDAISSQLDEGTMALIANAKVVWRDLSPHLIKYVAQSKRIWSIEMEPGGLRGRRVLVRDADGTNLAVLVSTCSDAELEEYAQLSVLLSKIECLLMAAYGPTATAFITAIGASTAPGPSPQ